MDGRRRYALRVVQSFADKDTVELIQGLRGRGWSLRRIARLLSAEGRPTARGRPWCHQSVALILEREQAGSHDAESG